MRGDSPQWSTRWERGEGLGCVRLENFHGVPPLSPLTLTLSPEDGGEGTGGRAPITDCTRRDKPVPADIVFRWRTRECIKSHFINGNQPRR